MIELQYLDLKHIQKCLLIMICIMVTPTAELLYECDNLTVVGLRCGLWVVGCGLWVG